MSTPRRKFLPMLILSSVVVGACAQERPPRSVQEFMDNPQFLEAAVVRCAANRAESRYDPECVNARQAVGLIEAREERARRDRLEAESEAKRDALRRTQRAAAAARREAEERARRLEEAAYLAQFGEQLPPEQSSDPLDLEANTPGAVIPEPAESGDNIIEDRYDEPEVIFEETSRPEQASIAPTDGGNAPVANTEATTDLTSIRDELKRRQEEPSN